MPSPIIIEQTPLGGIVNEKPYRYFLHAQLTLDALQISYVTWVLLTLALPSITKVHTQRNLRMFGFVVFYRTALDESRRLYLKTTRYQEWAAAFESVHVCVIPHRGWFDFV